MYENEQTLKGERETKEIIEKCWNVNLCKMPISYYIDYMGMRNNKPKMLVEIKNRNIRSDQYPDIMVSANKIMHGALASKFYKVPFVFVVKTSDKVLYHMYDEYYQYDIRYGGRTLNTRDSADIEPVVHIPIEKFGVLCSLT